MYARGHQPAICAMSNYEQRACPVSDFRGNDGTGILAPATIIRGLLPQLWARTDAAGGPVHTRG